MRQRKTYKTDPKTAILYIRVSTEEQSLGPQAQRAAAERWAIARGVTIAATFEDRGVSGGTRLEACPALLAALDGLRTHGAGVLLAAKRDRIARDPMKAGMVEALAARSGAAVISAAGEGEGDEPGAVLMRRMIDAFAEYERLVIKARTKAALAVKSRRGERVGSVPYGKRLSTDRVRLEDEPNEQSVILAARELRGSGLTFQAVANELGRRGLTSRRSATWHPMQIARMVA
jgi:DNA invertase Pin-like site-specific DNA recombinase